MTVLQLLVTIV